MKSTITLIGQFALSARAVGVFLNGVAFRVEHVPITVVRQEIAQEVRKKNKLQGINRLTEQQRAILSES